MPSLRDTQAAFATAMFGADPVVLSGLVREDGIAPVQRLAVYANNSRIGFEQALALTYPVIQRLAGEDWFRQHARSYQLRHPSRRGDLQYVGDGYADYLLSELAGTPYEYFADVARLEWACQQALVARDDGVLDPRSLADVAVEHYQHVVLVPRACVRLIESRFPLLAIWKTNQPDCAAEDAQVSIDDGPDRLAVIRRDDHIEVRALDPAVFSLLRLLASGATLGEAAESGSCGAEEFSAALSTVTSMRVFAKYQLQYVNGNPT